jgi:hypothetical protein
MAKEATFSSILDAPASESVRPPALPAGTYLAVIKGLPQRGQSAKKKTDFIEYTLLAMGPYTNAEGECDVDADELKAFEEVSGPVKGKELKRTFYMTEKSAYRHKEFLADDLRLDFPEDASHWAIAQQTGGTQVLVHMHQKPTDDGKGVYSEIASTAPVEE